MTPEALLEKFGYLAVYLGTILEGEGILVAAGFFAARGFLDLPIVIGVAFAGAYSGHILWFWLGRTQGVRLLQRFPWLGRHLGRSIRVFERYGAAAIVMTQWLYGLRITAAVMIGMSKISFFKFLVYEAASCAVWAVVVASAGFYFGRAIETLLGRIEHLERYGIAIIVLFVVGVWLWHRHRERQTPHE